jgi:hypothetical protein
VCIKVEGMFLLLKPENNQEKGIEAESSLMHVTLEYIDLMSDTEFIT